MPRYLGSALAVALFAIACEAPTTSELLDVRLVDPAPVQLDINCSNGCGPDTVAFDVTFNAHTLVSDTAEIELVQYRVDFDLPGVDGKVPYFAAYTSAIVPFGQTVTVPVQLLGDAQRAWLRPRLAGTSASGTAKVTFAGYDHRNEQVGTTAELQVALGDFVQGSR